MTVRKIASGSGPFNDWNTRSLSFRSRNFRQGVHSKLESLLHLPNGVIASGCVTQRWHTVAAVPLSANRSLHTPHTNKVSAPPHTMQSSPFLVGILRESRAEQLRWGKGRTSTSDINSYRHANVPPLLERAWKVVPATRSPHECTPSDARDGY